MEVDGGTGAERRPRSPPAAVVSEDVSMSADGADVELEY